MRVGESLIVSHRDPRAAASLAKNGCCNPRVGRVRLLFDTRTMPSLQPPSSLPVAILLTALASPRPLNRRCHGTARRSSRARSVGSSIVCLQTIRKSAQKPQARWDAGTRTPHAIPILLSMLSDDVIDRHHFLRRVDGEGFDYGVAGRHAVGDGDDAFFAKDAVDINPLALECFSFSRPARGPAMRITAPTPPRQSATSGDRAQRALTECLHRTV